MNSKYLNNTHEINKFYFGLQDKKEYLNEFILFWGESTELRELDKRIARLQALRDRLAKIESERSSIIAEINRLS
jgi:predicted nuclease with TOPRIM domain